MVIGSVCTTDPILQMKVILNMFISFTDSIVYMYITPTTVQAKPAEIFLLPIINSTSGYEEALHALNNKLCFSSQHHSL